MKLLLVAALLTIAMIAQTQTITYKKAITLSPLTLIQVDNNITAGVEYRLKNNLSLITEAGFVFGSGYFSDSKKTSGYIIRPAVRFYTNPRNNFYIQPQIFYKSVTYQFYDWLGKQCVNGVPAFEQLQDFKYRKNVIGADFVVGYVLHLFGKRGFIDLYFGGGVRYKTNKIVHEPNSCYQRRDVFIADMYKNGVTFPSLPAGVKLIYAIN